MRPSGRLGILTGGGDVPGLNAAIKGVVYRASELGLQVRGFRRGWGGLANLDPRRLENPDHVVTLDRANTRAIDRTGGTVLHTSRTNPRRIAGVDLPAFVTPEQRAQLQTGEDTYDLTPVVLVTIAALDLDALVVIGGDDTLSFARVLADAGVPVLAIPKTMDNDVPGTEYCIGFSSAISRAREVINRHRTTLGSHERLGVFRIFGRDAGFSALAAAYVTSSRCVIPEVSYDLDVLATLLAADRERNPSRYGLVITSEGAIWTGATMQELGRSDAFGHRHKANVGEALAAELGRRTGIETVAVELTYDLRSGDADSLDSVVATTFANTAMDLLAGGVTGRMVAIQGGRYSHTAIPDERSPKRRVDVRASYSIERLRPRYDGRIGDPMLLTGARGSDTGGSEPGA